MTLTMRQLAVVRDLLRAWGTPHTDIRQVTPLDHPVYGTTLYRAAINHAPAGFGDTVIIKRGRDEGQSRSASTMIRTEIATLRMLTARGTSFAPRMVGGNGDAGVVIMEDLDSRPSLEQVLFATDTARATAALNAFASTLGSFHTTMADGEPEFGDARRLAGISEDNLNHDPAILRDLTAHWAVLRDSVRDDGKLPAPGEDVDADIRRCLTAFANPGPYRTMVHGDACPANTRIIDGEFRFLDFEQTGYGHVLHDVVALHLPFPSCPCWSLMPDDVAEGAVNAWRKAYARSHPGVLDDDEYFAALAPVALLTALERIRPWARLDRADEPHPVGFSKRAQRIETIRAAVAIARRTAALPALTAWLDDFASALTDRWRDTPLTITVFPAFAAARPDLAIGMPLP